MPPPAEGFATRLVLGPALRTQPDGRLVKLVRSGYESAFEEIVRRYGKPLTRYAAAIVGNRGEDVVQDSFSKALLALRRDGAEIELRPWLYRIVRNTALNDLRDRPPSAEMLAEAVAGGRSPAEEAERREELTDLMQRLRSLPEPQRAAIVMRELEGLSHEEIAAALGLSGGAARQAIYRARRALRDGAGMLLPLSLLKALLAGSAAAPVEAAAGLGGTAGAGAALKAATATVLVAGAVGTGVVVQERTRQDADRTEARSERVEADAATAPTSPGAEGNSVDAGRTEELDDDRGRGGDDGRGDDDGGGSHDRDSSGPGPGEDRDRDRDGERRGHDDGDEDGERSGHRGGEEEFDDRDRGGHSGRSGSSHGGDDDADRSGPSQPDSSGPGGGSGAEAPEDNSGPGGGTSSGSGISSSGSGSEADDSDSSGSGSGSEDSAEGPLEPED
jgi:RNA polymerase sigma factor (sigma-70 family)